MLTIRPAVPDDALALLRLNAAFNGVEDVTEADVRRSLEDGREIVLIALVDGKPAGFCCAQVHHSFCYKTPEAELTEMYVDPAYRRRGCASQMLHRLAAILRADYGVDALHLLTGCGNQAAQALYRACGFRDKPEAHMTRSL